MVMANTIYEATYLAAQQITATFDMVWALDAGLWNLRQTAAQYFSERPEASNQEVKRALIGGHYVHGLNLKRIATELSWEYEEQYIAELLLINGMAVFDTWVDDFIDAVLIGQSNAKKEKIKKKVKEGKFSSLDSALAAEKTSSLSSCFHFTAKKQDKYIKNLCLVYKYFKSCRNCYTHGNRRFTNAAEKNYEAIKNFTKDDCGIKEFPKIAITKSGNPLKLILRGVVGFYDVLIRIISHYDLVAADKVGVEQELIKRWNTIPTVKFSPVEKKRNNSIRNYMRSVNMCPPYTAKTNDIYRFLTAHHAIA